jgi:hypothetical protein
MHLGFESGLQAEFKLDEIVPVSLKPVNQKYDMLVAGGDVLGLELSTGLIDIFKYFD